MLLSPTAIKHQIAQRLADRTAVHPVGRWVLTHAVAATTGDPSSSPARAAGLHLRSAFVRNPQLAVATTQHGTVMVVDLSDWRHQEIHARGTYEPHIAALLKRIAHPGWTFLDVGANVGYFAALASYLGGSSSTVHAFEPHPRMAAMAEINARMNHGVSYTVFEAACGATAQRLTLHLARMPGNIGDSTMITNGHSEGPTEEVAVVRLDDHCERHNLRPDVIKIDVEGFEEHVLEGMQCLLADRVPSHLIIEVVGDAHRPTERAVVSRLAAHGYEPRSISSAGHITAYAARIELQDVCFIRRRLPGETA